MPKTIHRFFVSPEALGKSQATLKDRELVHQISRVLRMHPDDPIILLNNKGQEFWGRIESITKKEVTVTIEKTENVTSEPEVRVRILQALPKRLPKFETILKHGTELGAREFYPMITAHGELRELRKRDRMEKIIKEAAEQSERGHVPVLGPELDLSHVLEHGWPTELEADAMLVAYARGDSPRLIDVATELKGISSLNVLIGPEGGFSDEEIEGLRQLGAQTFSLGKRILRTETASLAILSILLLGSNDFDQ